MSNLSGFIKRLRDIMRNDAGINGDAQRIEQIAWMLFLKVYDAKEQDWEFDDEDYVSILPEECRWANWAHDDKSGRAMTGDRLLDFVNNTLFPTLKKLPVDASTPIKKAIVQTTFADANNYMKDGVLLRQVINVIDELDLSDYEESHAFGEIYESILKELQSAGSAGEFYTPRAVTEFMARRIDPQIGERMADFACGTGGFLTSWLKALKQKVRTVEDEAQYSRSIYGIEKKQFPYMLCITNMLLHDLDVPQVFHDNSLLRDVLDYTEADQFDVVLMNPPYGGSEKAEVKNHFPADLASSETADLFMSVIMYRLRQNGRAAVILPDGFLFGTDNAKLNIKRKLLSEFDLHTVVRMPGSVFSPYTSITTNILFFDRTGPTEATWFYRLDMPEGYKHFSKTKPMKLEHFAPVLAWWDDRRELVEDGFPKAKRFTAKELAEDLGYNLDQCGYPHKEEEILAPLDLIQRYQEERASLNAIVDNALHSIIVGLCGDVTPPIPSIVNNALGRLVEIDSQFPEDMQKSILQMAIQGKLVEQRPEEGTGEDLYRQIQAEKQSLIQSGKLKKQKPLPEITEDEIPFDIPESWKWVRFDTISNIVGTGLIRPNSEQYTNAQYYYFKMNNIGNFDGKCYFDQMSMINASNLEYERYKLESGDFLFNTRNSRELVGKVAVVPPISQKIILNNNILKIKFLGGILPHFMSIFFNSPLGRSQIIHFITNTTNVAAVYQKQLITLLVPLPPLAEQKRIVARLEELLPLCEKLK